MDTGGRSLDIASLQRAYAEGALTPTELIEELLERIERTREHNAWISRLPDEILRAQAKRLEERGPEGLPLYGIPFAIKDNIDLAGLPTTAGCPAFAYRPRRSAFVVERLLAAGAIAIGKTNLDQFATGLVGTRTPEAYGVCRNSFDPDYIAGGSSSGSAVAVALGLASFSLGTDTAGSGRIPAAFNNLIGLKPTRGLLSTSGVVPACRSLDCVSIFALTADDANRVLEAACAFDEADPYARRNRGDNDAGAYALRTHRDFFFAIPRPEDLEFFGDPAARRLFEDALAHLQQLGGRAQMTDFSPFFEAGQLLYEGPWRAERLLAVGDLLERMPEALHPVTREILEPAGQWTASELFAAEHRLQALRRAAQEVLEGVDFAVTPTAPTIYQIEDVLQDPFRLNAQLGHYTNFMNLLDCAAIAVPAGFYMSGLPFGITLFSGAFSDRRLLNFARDLQQALDLPMGATEHALPPPCELPRQAREAARLVVCGAHLKGQPLNYQITSRGGRLLRQTRTAPPYRLYLLPGGPPYRPGLVRSREEGSAIEVEVWELSPAALGELLAQVPSPLCIGRVELEDGSREAGFLCESWALAGSTEITAFGGWRRYLESHQDAHGGRPGWGAFG